VSTKSQVIDYTWKRDLESFLDQVPKFERVEKELKGVLYFWNYVKTLTLTTNSKRG